MLDSELDYMGAYLRGLYGSLIRRMGWSYRGLLEMVGSVFV